MRSHIEDYASDGVFDGPDFSDSSVGRDGFLQQRLLLLVLIPLKGKGKLLRIELSTITTKWQVMIEP